MGIINTISILRELNLKESEVPFIKRAVQEHGEQILASRDRFVKQQKKIMLIILIVAFLLTGGVFGYVYLLGEDMFNSFIAAALMFLAVMIPGILVGVGGRNILARNTAYSIFSRWYRKYRIRFEFIDFEEYAQENYGIQRPAYSIKEEAEAMKELKLALEKARG